MLPAVVRGGFSEKGTFEWGHLEAKMEEAIVTVLGGWHSRQKQRQGPAHCSRSSGVCHGFNRKKSVVGWR